MFRIGADGALNQFCGLMDELMAAEGAEAAAKCVPLLEAAEGRSARHAIAPVRVGIAGYFDRRALRRFPLDLVKRKLAVS
jgi:hypothetical protein